jgi:hypothetical protein
MSVVRLCSIGSRIPTVNRAVQNAAVVGELYGNRPPDAVSNRLVWDTDDDGSSGIVDLVKTIVGIKHP